ncbi:hypothetical protein [Paenibacillus oleatilyticus]|uniref:hypothetical protein n=1 Tax=Paenibacillus oleatilyticus TaxID=2594886 RepID=UPI001C1FEFB8|nr:hypothetical protein [Paenibacillus oleatilyticus]MBU7316025.1 hypothetical protein [Paenibacillus oleatilyticus]
MKINKSTEEIYAVGVYNKGYLREDGTIINNVLKANFFDALDAAELVRDIYNQSQSDDTYAYIAIFNLKYKGTHEFEYPYY